MSMVVSKADALIEMVRAYDSQQIKRANKIGQILCKSIQSDNRNNMYSSYIGLDRESKQFFPSKVRKSLKKIKNMDISSEVEIIMDGNKCELKIGEQIVLISEKTS